MGLAERRLLLHGANVASGFTFGAGLTRCSGDAADRVSGNRSLCSCHNIGMKLAFVGQGGSRVTADEDRDDFLDLKS